MAEKANFDGAGKLGFFLELGQVARSELKPFQKLGQV